MLWKIILPYPLYIFHHSQIMLQALSAFEPAFIAGAILAAATAQYARGPFSVWLALLPGTIAHEFTHYLLALITGSRPRPISLRLQKGQGGGWQLGSVQFEPGMWTGGIVALAPLLVLPPIAFGLWREASQHSAAYALGAGYVALTLLQGAIPSRADWGIAIRYPLGTCFAITAMGLTISAMVS
jgi:hypothetical protein